MGNGFESLVGSEFANLLPDYATLNAGWFEWPSWKATWIRLGRSLFESLLPGVHSPVHQIEDAHRGLPTIGQSQVAAGGLRPSPRIRSWAAPGTPRRFNR